MEKNIEPYDEAHLFVAAVRILFYQKGAPPSVDDVCRMLSWSLERGHALCRRLAAPGIIETVEDSFSIKLFVADHGKIEEIPRGQDAPGLAREIENFQKNRQDMTGRVEGLQAELSRKKQDLFAELEKKMKEMQK